jgi:secreted PhoX family phosphatase
MSTSRHNGLSTTYTGATLQPTPRVIDHTVAGPGDTLVGTFGNNWMFYVPIDGPDAGEIVPFGYGPPRCELTGPTFVGDTLIVSVQHPGEDSPVNGDPAAGGLAASTVVNTIEMLKRDGSGVFTQARTLPRGSNFPSNLPIDVGGTGAPPADAPSPKPAVIGIRRKPSA